MSEFLEIGSAADVADGTMVGVKVEGHELLVANVNGTFLVADMHCPHLHGNLSKGVLEGTIVTCPLHHSQFDLTDGSVVRWTDWTGPVKTMAELARHPRPLRVYDAKVEGGRVFVGPQKEPTPAKA